MRLAHRARDPAACTRHDLWSAHAVPVATLVVWICTPRSTRLGSRKRMSLEGEPRFTTPRLFSAARHEKIKSEKVTRSRLQVYVWRSGPDGRNKSREERCTNIVIFLNFLLKAVSVVRRRERGRRKRKTSMLCIQENWLGEQVTAELRKKNKLPEMGHFPDQLNYLHPAGQG